MANLHQHSVQESLNATTGGEWTVATAGTAGSSASVANTTHKLLTPSTSTLGVYSAVEIYFNFSTTTTDVNASNDLLIPANTNFLSQFQEDWVIQCILTTTLLPLQLVR